jgi:hypothetical protein
MKLKKTKKDIIEAIKTKKKALKTEMFEIDAKVQAVAPPSFVDALAMSAKNKQMVIDRMKEKEKEKKELMAQTVDRKANATPKTDAMKKMKLVEQFVNESFKGKSTLKENVLSVLTPSRADLTKLIKNARENEVKYTISRLAEGYQFNYQFEVQTLQEETDAEKLKAYKDAKHTDLGSEELNLKNLDLIRKMNDANDKKDMKLFKELQLQQQELMKKSKVKKEDLAYSQIFEINNWAQEKIDELGIEACIDNQDIINEFEKEAKKAGYKGQDLEDAIMAVQIYIQSEYEKSLGEAKKPVQEKVADNSLLKLIKKHVELLDEVKLDEPSVDWLSDEFDDEAYAGGFWDASMNIAHEIIGIENLDMNENFDELTETIYNIIKYGNPFAVKSTPKKGQSKKSDLIKEEKPGKKPVSWFSIQGKKDKFANEAPYGDDEEREPMANEGPYGDDEDEELERLQHLKDLYDIEPGDLTDEELEELRDAGMLEESKHKKHHKEEKKMPKMEGVLEEQDISKLGKEIESYEELEKFCVDTSWCETLTKEKFETRQSIYDERFFVKDSKIYADAPWLTTTDKFGNVKNIIDRQDIEKRRLPLIEESGEEHKDEGEYDEEGDMAKSDLKITADAALELHSMLADDENLPEWVQAKITLASDYIDTARDYMKAKQEGKELPEPQEEMMKEDANSSLGRRTGVITVAEYKGFLNDALEVVAYADDKEKIRLASNTYKLEVPFIGTYGGYIAINSPISEDQSEDEVEEGKKHDKDEKKPLKESALSNSKFRNIIGEYFNYSSDFDFLDVVAQVLDRVDFEGDKELIAGGEHADEVLTQAIDDALTYTQDQWFIAEHYASTPADLDWQEVVQEFSDDMYAVFKLVNDSIK